MRQTQISVCEKRGIGEIITKKIIIIVVCTLKTDDNMV